MSFSHPVPVGGEYAGVEGAESMKVPNDFADAGGDMGAPGVGGGEPTSFEGEARKVGKRWLRVPVLGAWGVLGMPWLERGRKAMPRRVLMPGAVESDSISGEEAIVLWEIGLFATTRVLVMIACAPKIQLSRECSRYAMKAERERS